MIRYLHLSCFKAFEEINLPFSPLTLFSGINGAGKSTCLQSLLLLHQTARTNEGSTHILFNSECVALGSFGDVINRKVGRYHFNIGFSTNEGRIDWQIGQSPEERDRRARSAAIHKVKIEEGEVSTWNDPTQLRRLLPREMVLEGSPLLAMASNLIYNLKYVSAERIGPRDFYELSTPYQKHSVGSQGEFTAWFLHHFAQNEVMQSLRHAAEPNPMLQRQVSAWLGHFFPGAGFQVNSVPNSGLVTLLINTAPGGEQYHPKNVGYGLTHILPVLTAIIGSQKGDLVIIENPEAHLHPSGQALMGAFLAKAAASGIQIILETHSDHILNGIRRTVKEGVLPPNDAVFHFLAKPNSDDRVCVQTIQVDSQGNLSDWPSGFFDQFDKDTSFFAGW